MIISASRRTDIPAFYSDWFFNRLKEGHVLVRNPMNFHQVSCVMLNTEVVDAFVFWTKNPENMIDRLCQLEEYPFYFNFTFTPYGKEIEKNAPDKKGRTLDTFKRLADKVGCEKVVWRYDPILFSENASIVGYNLDYHKIAFERMARELQGLTKKVIFSFVETKYRETTRNLSEMQIREITEPEKLKLCMSMAESAQKFGIKIEACASEVDYEDIGIGKATCIDKGLLELISGKSFTVDKDRNQREKCGCVSSIDIGAYNTCLMGCLYCYANYSSHQVEENYKAHGADRQLITGVRQDGDVIYERKMHSHCS